MVKRAFEERLREKVDAAYERTININKNRSENKEILKEKMIKNIENTILLLVPKMLDTKECKLLGPFISVYEASKGNLVIDVKDAEVVYFSTLEEIREFIEEIVREFPNGLIYELDKCDEAGIRRATISFKYEYKGN